MAEPSKNEWAPPAVTKPITPEIYVQLAMVIEAGTKLVAWEDQHPGESARMVPSPHNLAVLLYDYIPAASIPLKEGLEEADRSSIETFKVGRPVLMAALKAATPPTVLAKIGDTSGADAPGPEGGINWWVVSLGAGGYLSWIGRSKVIGALVTLTNRKRLILAFGAGLLYTLGAVLGAMEVLPAAKKAAGTAWDDLVQKPLAQAGSVLGIVLGVGIAGVAAILLINFARSQNTKQSESRAIAA